MFRTAAGVCVVSLICWAEATVPRGCPASVSLGSFQVAVQPPAKGGPLAAKLVNVVEKGYKIIYAPQELPAELDKKKARVSLVLVPADNTAPLTVTDPELAGARAEWTAPYRVSVIGMVFGPQGLDHKKVESLVSKDREMVSQLADYAEHTAQVESLIETLAAAEQGPSSSRNLDAALTGFASHYGTSIPKLDRSASTDQQAMMLVQTLNPALGAYDPLAPTPATRMQQSAGLATSVAALFFGSNVGLAAGGAAMVQNFHTMLFPGTDFRSALAQPAAHDGFTLCAKRQPAKSRTRIAYLWAYRIPNAGTPALALQVPSHVPLGVKSPAAVEATPAAWSAASRARDWTRVSADGRPAAVPVKPSAEGRSFEIDLGGAGPRPAPGVYHLEAKWDWTTLRIGGDVNVHAPGDLKAASVTADSRDRLVEGAGAVTVKLAGTDFEFVEKLTLDKQPLEVKLPDGRRAGPQQTMETAVDTGRFKAGTYRLAMYQADGKAVELPVRVLPPNPVIANVPLRVNLGEQRQRVVLRGSGLGRIERIESRGAAIELGECARDAASREMFVHLGEAARTGDRIALELKVEGRESPLEVAEAIEVAGPRPRIAGLSISVAEDLGVALRDGELPSGSFASVSMRVENAETRPTVRIECVESEKTIETQTLRAGERRTAARVDSSGPDTLFVSLDAGAIGRAGCTLNAVVETEAAGRSDPRALGRVVRLPKITGFTLTDEKVGDAAYMGVIEGYDLEIIERAGWNAQTGLPVAGLPKPVAGERDRQSLRIPLPWPPPSPHAPVYIWLRGQPEGRATRAKY
jgi:hypothetical protein